MDTPWQISRFPMAGRPPYLHSSTSEFARPRVHVWKPRKRHPYTNRVKYDQRKLRKPNPKDGGYLSIPNHISRARFPRCHPVPLTSCPMTSSCGIPQHLCAVGQDRTLGDIPELLRLRKRDAMQQCQDGLRPTWLITLSPSIKHP